MTTPTTIQYCDGTTQLRGHSTFTGDDYILLCPGCPNCERKGRPVQTTIMPPQAEPTRMAPLVQTIELGPKTLRALYQVLYEIGMLSDPQRIELLAELGKEKP